MNALYQHIDGMGELSFDAASCRLFAGNESEGLSAYVLIGPDGLRDVAAKLLALADGDALSLAGALTPKVWTDKQGVVRKVLSDVRTKDHDQQVLVLLKELSK